ncbi:LysR family glycine cleavage system transcriptional activator OS=Castellaniella defragrans OX=75697 GN=HNR28_001162 PE=3 SV=1 [Castellaniella defragrans]
MSDRLPSLKALRIFEAAGRHRGYSSAAEELFLTHSAVSHQIKALEAELGTKLFRRVGHSMLLTEDGQRLHHAMNKALTLIAKGVAEVRADDRPQTLNVSAPPSLAIWLVPRLANFRRRHPQLEINLSGAIALVDFSHDDVDLALRFGHGVWPGLRADRLPLDDLVYLAVCSPTYRHGRLPRTVGALRKCTLIHHPFMSWAEWFKTAGGAVEPSMPGPHFNEYLLAMQAALSGQGVMLANSIMISAELASGQLVPVLQDQLAFRQSSAYYIVFPESRTMPSKARVFCDWLLEQAHQSAAAKSSA